MVTRATRSRKVLYDIMIYYNGYKSRVLVRWQRLRERARERVGLERGEEGKRVRVWYVMRGEVGKRVARCESEWRGS